MIKEDLSIDNKDSNELSDLNDVWVSNIRTHEELQVRLEKLENGGEWSMHSYTLNDRAETYHKSASAVW